VGLTVPIALIGGWRADQLQPRHPRHLPALSPSLSTGQALTFPFPSSLFSHTTEIVNHLLNFNRPELQRHVVRILWMVPIYAVESWTALRFKEIALYLSTAREAYESLVIYSFLMYLIAYLGEEVQLRVTLSKKDPHATGHLWGFRSILSPWNAHNGTFLRRCKQGVLQYVCVKLGCALLALVLLSIHVPRAAAGPPANATNVTNASLSYDVVVANGTAGPTHPLEDLYGEGHFALNRGYVYIAFFTNFSQMVAMYCLVLFYHATYEELKPIKPLAKFLCVKAVVFMTFWQSVGISALVQAGVIHETATYTTEDVALGLQSFIICVEMFFAGVSVG
jgi:hypothetical protein